MNTWQYVQILQKLSLVNALFIYRRNPSVIYQNIPEWKTGGNWVTIVYTIAHLKKRVEVLDKFIIDFILSIQ